MKTSMIPRDITLVVCTVSTSILLCATLDVQAAPPQDETIPWDRGSIPILSWLTPDLNLNQNHVANWHLNSAKGWYVNLLAVETRLNGYVRSANNGWQATQGNAVTLSVQGGYPISIGENWVIEPQAQLINQRTTVDSQSAASANAAADEQTSWSGRVGARLQGNYQVSGLPVEPYLRTNLWHTYSGGGTLRLGQVEKISSSRYSTTVEVGLGLLANVSPNVSLFVSGDYSGSTDNAFGLIGNVGVRIRW